MIAKQQVAQDITVEITDSELEYAQQLIDECLGAHSAGKIGEHSAISWQGGQILVVLCVWHEDAPLRKVRYGVEFVREARSFTPDCGRGCDRRFRKVPALRFRGSFSWKAHEELVVTSSPSAAMEAKSTVRYFSSFHSAKIPEPLTS